VRDIVACRTEQLGGHLEVCKDCGFSRGSYNSCRNRHCPKCQILKQELWAEAQEALLLPTLYFQIVFTIPRELHAFFRRAPQVCLTLLFEAVSETLSEIAHTNLKATIGFTAVLHTWNQQLGFHPHIHCVVPAGGLSLDGLRWVATSRWFFLPVKRLRKLFRGKLLSKIEGALRAGEILGDLANDLALLRRTPKFWNVHAKPPLAGPGHVVRYLSRYVHRIAIANPRITDYDSQNVTFRYKDRGDGNVTKHARSAGPTSHGFSSSTSCPRASSASDTTGSSPPGGARTSLAAESCSVLSRSPSARRMPIGPSPSSASSAATRSSVRRARSVSSS
jgi:hypothetical protein